MFKKKQTVFIFLILSFITTLFSCNLVNDFFEDGKTTPGASSGNSNTISYFQLQEKTANIKVGELRSIKINYSPSNINISKLLDLDYDSSVIAVKTITSTSIVIEGIKEGTCFFRAGAGNYSDVCTIKVEGFSDNYIQNQPPYIYSATSIVDMGIHEKRKIYVSLYNGTVTDNNNYTWAIDNKDVAAITPTGQYCIIEGLSKGYAQITVRNSSAEYPYYIGVYVSENKLASTYITTKDNIVTLYTSGQDKTVSVDLVNPINQDYQNKFTWELYAGNGETSYDTSCVSIIPNGKDCVISPKKAGTACIRVKHPDVTGGYPLDIIVRVISIVNNVYIVPEQTLIEVSDTSEHSFKSSLVGLSNYDVDGFTYEISDDRLIDCNYVGDTFWFKGKCNGAVSVYIHHENAAKSRQVLILLTNQAGGSIDSSYYITTSQNFIKTKVGAEETRIDIALKGGFEGDENDFSWTIKQEPADGTGDVIKLDNVTGNAFNARAVTSVYANGHAIMTPLKEGTATIILTHPKVYYPTEILVKVLSKDALINDPLYFKGDAIVRFLNSETYDYEVTLSGDNKSSTDDSKIAWSTEDSYLKINSNGARAQLSSSTTGQNVGHFLIAHNKVENPKSVLVLTADTQEELNSMKALYTDKKYYSVNVNSTIDLYTNSVGFGGETGEDGVIKPFDWKSENSKVYWTSSNSSIATVEKISSDTPLFATVTGKQAGKAIIKVQYENYFCEWEVTVYPENVQIGEIETTAYLTTTQNVISLNRINEEKKVTVSAIGINSGEYSNINWTSNNPDIAQIRSNGTSATIIAKAEGEAIITVDHPKSENSLKIYVRVGNEYVQIVNPVCHISANQDIFAILKDSGMQQLVTTIVNAPESSDTNQFSFTTEDTDIIEIKNQYRTGTCYFMPVEAGQAVIKVKNSLCEYDKEILVVVANTEEELKGFKYLSTKNNTVTIGEGKTYKLDVTVENTDELILSGFTWSSNDRAIVDIQQSTAGTVVLHGNSIGTTQIQVRHEKCTYPLNIIVQVVDPISLAATPYIQVSSAIKTLNVSTEWTDISAELVGGNAESKYKFRWSSRDSSILQVVGEQDKAKIRAIAEGTTYVEVSNAEAPYPVQVLCICSKVADESYSISVSCTNMVILEPDAKMMAITATLNGPKTDVADPARFSAHLSEYSIVDLRYNDNTFYIEPLKQGETTLTISHPKSLYSKSVLIRVSKYNDFAIGNDKVYRVQAGDVTFIDMKVPAFGFDTEVIYSLENPKLATVSGTKSICVLQGVEAGLTTLYAKVVKASNINEVVASADAQIQVTPADISSTYIQTQNSIYQIQKGTNSRLLAGLVGSDVTATDARNLKWQSSNPDVVRISGVDSTGTAVGEEVFVEALSSGECTITISHEKAPSNRVLRIVVPGVTDTTISLNKTYIGTETGDNRATLTATLNGDEYDYSDIVWEIEKSNGETLAQVLGNGKTITILSLKAGTTRIFASLPNGRKAECQLMISSPKKLTVNRQVVRVQPNHTVTVPYTISPASDAITVQCYSNDGTGKEYVSVEDLGHSGNDGTLAITGFGTGEKEQAQSTCVLTSSSGSVTQFIIICSWDYDFRIDKDIISGRPDKSFEFEFKCTPAPSIEVNWTGVTLPPGATSSKLAEVTIHKDLELTENGYTTGRITIMPLTEGEGTLKLTATNLDNGDIIGTREVDVVFRYTDITPKIIVERSAEGGRTNFTYYDDESQVLYLGDGEKVLLQFGFEEKGVAAVFSDIVGDLYNYSPEPVTFQKEQSSTLNKYWIEHSEDYIEWQYKITEGYSPSTDGRTAISFDKVRINTHIYLDDHQDKSQYGWPWQSSGDLYYDVIINGNLAHRTTKHWYESWIGYDTVNLATKLRVPSVRATNAIRNTALDGQVYTPNSFENNAFYYMPAFSFYCLSNKDGAGLEHKKGEIFYPYISAIKRASADDSIIYNGEKKAFVITVKVSHGGIEKKLEIPVYVQKRPCFYGYTKDCGREFVTEVATKGVGLTVYNEITAIDEVVPDLPSIDTTLYGNRKDNIFWGSSWGVDYTY